MFSYVTCFQETVLAKGLSGKQSGFDLKVKLKTKDLSLSGAAYVNALGNFGLKPYIQINFDLRPNFGLKLQFKNEVKSKLPFKTKVYNQTALSLYFCILIRFQTEFWFKTKVLVEK